MAKTIVGLFDNFGEARHAVDELVRSGFKRENISIVANKEARERFKDEDTGSDAGTGAAVGATTGAVVGGAAGLIASLAGLTIPVIGPIIAAGPIVATLSGAGVGAVAGGLIGALVNAGVPEDEARHYEEGVRRGGTLVTLTAEDSTAERAAEILNKNGAVDIRRRATEWRSGAGAAQTAAGARQPAHTNVAANQTPTAGAQANIRRGENEVTVPVVEEDARIGKREVESGGVRVTSHVSEKPVEEKVTLHEERVNVERRPVDRPASAADLRQQPGETIELRERREEPVVQKTARVVEEVVVNKEAQNRTETVHDTARRKDVDVQQLGGHAGERSFNDYENDFRTYHTKTYSNSGAYDSYAPAYRYGYDLAGNRNYSGRDWTAIESDARRDWESRNPGTWDRFKNQVHYAWDRVRDKVS